jgi:hypothetical protein
MVASDSAFMEFVDPRRGVLAIEYFDNEADEPLPRQNKHGNVISAERLCGPELLKRMAPIRKRLAQAAQEDLRVPSEQRLIACSNKPRVECHLAGSHDDADLYLQLVVDQERGLVIDSAMTLQQATMTEKWRKRQDEYVQSQRARLGSARCGE